jgi:hypothetical protein
MSVGPGSHLAELLLINGHEAVLGWMKKVASTDNYQNPRFAIIEDPMEGKTINHWTEEDGKEDTPSPEKKKPTVEELAKAVEKTSLDGNDGSPKKAHNTKDLAAAMKKDKDQVQAGDLLKEDMVTQTPGKEDKTQAATSVTAISCIEEVPADPVIPENPAEQGARLKKEVEEAEAEKQVRLKKKKEEEESSNLEHMRRTVLHALDGVEGLLGSVFNRGDSRTRADGDEEAEAEAEDAE